MTARIPLHLQKKRGRPRKVIPDASAPVVAPIAPEAATGLAAGLPDDLLALLRDPKLKAALKYETTKQLSYRRLERFKPYPKQNEFFAATKTSNVVMMLAGNRCGKSYSAAALVAMHATGVYPDDFPGKRFDEPVRIWAAGVNAEVTRDVQQNELIGPPSRETDWGSGLIPKGCLGEHSMLRGVASAIDTISVKHVSSGYSQIQFKSFAQGREKFQGTAQHIVWLDEECDLEIFSESLMRCATTAGLCLLTFTPLNGYTPLVNLFLGDNSPGTVIRATLDDALHFDDETRSRMIRQMMPHEREARSRGEPALGSGAIFPYTDAQITYPARAMPRHFASLGAIDFGFAHETGAVKINIDREADVIYVSHSHKAAEMTPVLHAATLKGWGERLVWAFPHDGDNRERGSGDTVADMYRRQGLRMLSSPVRFPDGGNSVEAGIQEMMERFQTGRLLIADNLTDLLQEIRRYHRRDGRIVKTHDHLIDALRYAIMGRRHATTPDEWTDGPLIRNYRRLV